MRYVFIGLILVITLVLIVVNFENSTDLGLKARIENGAAQEEIEGEGGLNYEVHPLAIEALRKQKYPGSELIVEQELEQGSNYSRYIVSFKSEGLKQFAMLTIPNGETPEGGWPGIIFNHGYIKPSEYKTTEKYVAYLDGFAKQGYVVLKPDYRGHGNSEGRAEGGYGSPAYTIDAMNALSSLQVREDVNADKIGMWGHSMGGWITQRAMVISDDVQAGVIWAGAVGSYEDLYSKWWGRRQRLTPTPQLTPGGRGYWRRIMTQEFGTFEKNPEFWNSLSITSHLEYLSSPIQLHHATGDEIVPYELSISFDETLRQAGKISDLHVYEGGDHNLSVNFTKAMQDSVNFFDAHLK